MQYDVSFPGLGIYNIHLDRVAIKIMGINIYWYGILIAAAVLLTMYLALGQAAKYHLRKDDILDAYIYLIPTILVSARLYFVIFAWHEFKDNLWAVFDTRRGGMAFYGGVIGGIILLVLLTRYKKQKLMNWLDFFAVYLPLGQAIGRFGNFINQEAFGTNTDLPWGMISQGTTAYLQSLNIPGLDPSKPVHPTFLYEVIGNLLIVLLLVQVRKNTKVHGETFAWYLLSYGALRFVVESLRTDALFIGQSNIRVSMLLSALMLLAGVIYIALIAVWDRKDKIPAQLVKIWGEADIIEDDSDQGINQETKIEVDSVETDADNAETDAVAETDTVAETDADNAETDTVAGTGNESA